MYQKVQYFVDVDYKQSSIKLNNKEPELQKIDVSEQQANPRHYYVGGMMYVYPGSNPHKKPKNSK